MRNAPVVQGKNISIAADQCKINISNKRIISPL